MMALLDLLDSLPLDDREEYIADSSFNSEPSGHTERELAIAGLFDGGMDVGDWLGGA